MKKALRRAISLGHALKLTRPIDLADKSTRPPIRLDNESVKELELRIPFGSATPMERRLMEGDLCYVVRDENGEVGSFVWVASGRKVYFYELDENVWVPGNVAYFYDAFTFPKVRGQGSMSELLETVAASLHDTRFSVERCEAWTDASNKPALRAFAKAGFEVYGSFRWLAVGSARLRTASPRIGKNGE